MTISTLQNNIHQPNNIVKQKWQSFKSEDLPLLYYEKF